MTTDFNAIIEQLTNAIADKVVATLSERIDRLASDIHFVKTHAKAIDDRVDDLSEDLAALERNLEDTIDERIDGFDWSDLMSKTAESVREEIEDRLDDTMDDKLESFFRYNTFTLRKD